MRQRKVFLLLMVVFLAAVIAAAAVHAERDRNAKAANVSATKETSKMTSAEYQNILAEPDKKFELVIKGDKLVSGPSKISVNLGDSVNVRITTPDDEIQAKLDGYNIRTEATNIEGTEGGFIFLADKAGVFPFYVVEEADEDQAATANGSQPKQVQLGTIEVK